MKQSAEFLIPASRGTLVTVEEVVTSPGSRLEGHRHAGAHVCVVLGGFFEERSPGGGFRPCAPGTIRVSPAGRGHEIRFGPDGAHCLLFVLPPSSRGPAEGVPTPIARDLFRNGDLLMSLAIRARAEARRAAPDAPLVVEQIVAEMIARAVEAGPPPDWLVEARRVIDEGYRLPVSLSRLAEDLAVPRARLSRAFTRHFGRSARSHLRTLRVAEAARLVAGSDLPLTEIAAASGFFDQSHLTRAFRERFGAPPAAFRRAARSRKASAWRRPSST